MTITINLTDQEAAQASKALTELIQTCAEAAQTDAPRNNNNNNNNNTAPKAKAKPKAEPAPTPQPAPPTEAAPEPGEAAIDYAELRDALKAECAAIARDGKTKALKALLADYGVEKLSELPDNKIEEFRAAAKAL
nr:hypothetical protein [uncultured Selenomonas sp.]